MDHEQEPMVAERSGPGAWPQPDATAARSASSASRRQPRRKEPGREALFDIADFEAIAAFAGLQPRPRRLG
jgi:hypothetical protein